MDVPAALSLARMPRPMRAEGPNESNTLRLDNGDLLCVYRVGSRWDFHKSISADEGQTWSSSVRMEGMASVQPRLARLGNGAIVLTGGRPGLFLWLCADGQGEEWERVNLGVHHNRLVEPKCGFFGRFLQRAGWRGPLHEYVLHRADALGSRRADRGLRPLGQRLGRRSGTEWGRRSGI